MVNTRAFAGCLCLQRYADDAIAICDAADYAISFLHDGSLRILAQKAQQVIGAPGSALPFLLNELGSSAGIGCLSSW